MFCALLCELKIEVAGFFAVGFAILEFSGASITASNRGIIKRQEHIVLLISIVRTKHIETERITS